MGINSEYSSPLDTICFSLTSASKDVVTKFWCYREIIINSEIYSSKLINYNTVLK